MGKGSITLGLLGGLIVGGIAAVLLAPKSGAETRAMLAERSAPLRAKADELVRPAVERTRHSVAPFADRLRPSAGRNAQQEETVEEPAVAA